MQENRFAVSLRHASSQAGLDNGTHFVAGWDHLCLVYLAVVFGATDADRYAVTVPDALAALSRLTLLHYKVDDKIAVTKLPMPDEQRKRILDALKVSLPSK